MVQDKFRGQVRSLNNRETDLKSEETETKIGGISEPRVEHANMSDE